MSDKISLLDVEGTNELFDFLCGALVPDGFKLKHKPKLSAQKAFTIIYMLQERYGAIPDYFELCSACNRIFDSNREGAYREALGKHLCGDCDY